MFSDQTPLEETKDPQIANQENSKNSEEANPTNRNTIKELPPKENKPNYIAADFEANPALDFLIGNNLRSNEIVFVIEKKIGNISLSSLDDVIEFRFSGKVKSGGESLPEKIKVNLFSNKKLDYEDFKPISSTELNIQKVGEDYRFDFQRNIKLKPGLYYYTLEDENGTSHQNIRNFMITGFEGLSFENSVLNFDL